MRTKHFFSSSVSFLLKFALLWLVNPVHALPILEDVHHLLQEEDFNHPEDVLLHQEDVLLHQEDALLHQDGAMTTAKDTEIALMIDTDAVHQIEIFNNKEQQILMELQSVLKKVFQSCKF